MKTLLSRTTLLTCSLLVSWQMVSALTQSSTSSSTNNKPAVSERDGQHDFDFEFGTWKTHLRRLQHPLTGSKTWVEYDGTTVVRKVWSGRANLVELEVDGPTGH